MPWVNLSRLLANLRQRRLDPRDIAVFVDEGLVDPSYRRPLAGHLMPEETGDSNEGDWEED
ncbi:hypothetical protein ACFLTP_09020 [Chloroflexota bacterium]